MSGNFTKTQLEWSKKKYKKIMNDREILQKVYQTIEEVKVLSIQDSPDVFINVDPKDYFVDTFYDKFDLILDNTSFKIVIMSATIDEYTEIMFNVNHDNIYFEHKQFLDYSKSEFFTFSKD